MVKIWAQKCQRASMKMKLACGFAFKTKFESHRASENSWIGASRKLIIHSHLHILEVAVNSSVVNITQTYLILGFVKCRLALTSWHLFGCKLSLNKLFTICDFHLSLRAIMELRIITMVELWTDAVPHRSWSLLVYAACLIRLEDYMQTFLPIVLVTY